MAVAEYITKVELEALETRIMDALADMCKAIADIRGAVADIRGAMADIRGAMATKADVRAEADRMIAATASGNNPNF